MEVITFDSAVYKELNEKITKISDFVTSLSNEKADNEESWIDSDDVCVMLKISKRTLQRLRSRRMVEYSLIQGKIYYKIKEIRRLLENNVVRRNSATTIDLLEANKNFFPNIKCHGNR